MQELIKGIHSFQERVFPKQKDLFAKLAYGQQPNTLFITCSDSRVVPSLFTQTGPGEMFVIRNAGNLVPAYSDSDASGEIAAVEYAVKALNVSQIVVCGHAKCGAMKAVLDPNLCATMPSVGNWLVHANSTREIMTERYQHLHGDQLLAATVEENVLVQIQNLQTHPAVAERLERGELTIHGWVYEFHTGEVYSYDADSSQFVPVRELR